MLRTLKMKIKKHPLVFKTFQTIFSLVSFLPKNKKLVMFESFNGRQYSDSPRAIYEHLKEHHPEYRLVWSVDKHSMKQFTGRGLELAPRFSIKWLWLMPRAKYWVSNSRFPKWYRKSKRTVYLQTWHGTPLKKLGVDIEDVQMAESKTETYRKHFVEEAAKWDYLVSPNRYSTDIFRRAFGFTNHMIESGYPRNDYLVTHNNPEQINAVKKKMGLPADKKVILYAPTWRDDTFYDRGRYKFDIQLDLAHLQKEFGDRYVILLRMHYLVAENLDLTAYGDFVYDYSNYEDIRDLYLVSDVLMTDYSSVFFDYGILGRPMLFYVYDIGHYRDTLRGFYLDFEKMAPGPLVKTTSEVIDVLKDIEQNGFKRSDAYEDLQRNYTYLEDGRATERVVNEVFRP